MGDQLAAYLARYEAMEATRRKLKALQMDEAEKERRMDSLRFQIGELERADLKPGEEEALLQRRNLLRNSEKFMSAVQGAMWSLSGGDEGGGAAALLRDVNKRPETFEDLKAIQAKARELCGHTEV